MSDNIPIEIQEKILNRLPVKSLIQFRSVSKSWKSLIDSSDFIAQYNGQQQHLLVRYKVPSNKYNYVSIVDDHTFPRQRVSCNIPPLVKKLEYLVISGCCRGLYCLYGRYDSIHGRVMAVIWNLSIRKTVGIVVPNMGDGIIYGTLFGFGVCRETNDPKIVKITHIKSWRDVNKISCIPWQVEVFTLSTGAWRSPYNLPRKSVRFCNDQVVIDGVLYWLAVDRIVTDGVIVLNNLILSFDITSEEFKEVNLPDSLAQASCQLSVSKTRESLVVLNHGTNVVWMMEDGVSKTFTKLFTISVNVPFRLVGFKKGGEPLILVFEDGLKTCRLAVYEPYSKHIDDVVIDDLNIVFYYVQLYVESLLLLDQPNMMVYDETETL